jgi:hypothetical protein
MPARRSDNGRPGHLDLTLFGISDMELLAIVDDLADEDGWTQTLEVRLQLGESVDKGYRSGVGPRLSWMVRYGWLERNILTAKKPGNERQWRLTAIGHALLDNPKMTAAFQRTFQQLNPAQRLVLARELGEGAHGSADEIRNALRRQWMRSLGGR